VKKLLKHKTCCMQVEWLLTLFLMGYTLLLFNNSCLANSEPPTIYRKLLTIKANPKIKDFQPAVVFAKFSYDGSMIVTTAARPDNTACVWNAQTGSLIRKFSGHTSDVWTGEFSRDGTTILTGSHDSTARLWDITTGNQKMEIYYKDMFGGYSDILLTGATFSPNERLILITGVRGKASLWSIESGQKIRDFPDDQDGRFSLCNSSFSPNGNKVAIGSFDGRLRIYDVESGDLLNKIDAHSDKVFDVEYSHDGAHIATASWDKTAKIWDSESGKLLAITGKHKGYVYRASFSPDGRLLLATSEDGVYIWDTQAMPKESLHVALAQKIEFNATIVNSAFFSPNGQKIAVACGDGCCYVLEATAEENGNSKANSDIKFCSQCGKQLSPDSKFCPSCGKKVRE
jgi:WD40 repeat protein